MRKRFDGLQANILKPHDKEHVVFVSFKWKAAPDGQEPFFQNERAKWLLEIISTNDPDRSKLTFFEDQSNAAIIFNIFLSHFGYKKLNLSEEFHQPVFPNVRPNGTYDPNPFRQELFYGIPPSGRPQLHNVESDGIILLAAQTRDEIDSELNLIFSDGYQSLFEPEEMRTYWGHRKFRGNPKINVGPLGFDDGIANLRELAEVDEAAVVRSKEAPDSALGSFTTLILLDIVRYQFEITAWKIVGQIEEQLRAMAPQVSIDSETLYRHARGLIVGRREKGGSLSGGDRTDPLYFGNDLNGHLCPFRSHVRSFRHISGSSSYPQIVRRGVRWVDQEYPEAELGLIFLSYHNDLRRQMFEGIYKIMRGNFDFLTYSNLLGDEYLDFQIKVPKTDIIVDIRLQEKDLHFKYWAGEAYYFVPAKSFFDTLKEAYPIQTV